jgi:hypothetical protein
MARSRSRRESASLLSSSSSRSFFVTDSSPHPFYRLLNIEFSYKYTYAEALALFHLSGLRLIQHWTDSSSSHSLYLVEKPRMWFPSSYGSAARMLGIEVEDKEKSEENEYSVPSMEEWEGMWKAWDGLMVRLSLPLLLLLSPSSLQRSELTFSLLPSKQLKVIPPSLRFTKPIPLRHVPLFYIGHIPAFCDIHLSRFVHSSPSLSSSH